MSHFAAYSFINLSSGTLRQDPAFHALDVAFFEQNPQRNYRVRPGYDGEIDEVEYTRFLQANDLDTNADEESDTCSIWAIIHKDANGQLHRRSISIDGRRPDGSEITGRWIWQIWETDYTGGVPFYDYEIGLLERVFQNLSRTASPGT